MKKFVIAVFTICLLCATNFFVFDVRDVVGANGEMQVKTYFLEKPNYEFDYAYPYYIVNKNCNDKNIAGKSFCFDFDQTRLDKILASLDARLVKYEKIDKNSIFYYCSDCIKKNVPSQYGKFNLQISMNKEKIIIGYPIIFGSF